MLSGDTFPVFSGELYHFLFFEATVYGKNNLLSCQLKYMPMYTETPLPTVSWLRPLRPENLLKNSQTHCTVSIHTCWTALAKHCTHASVLWLISCICILPNPSPPVALSQPPDPEITPKKTHRSLPLRKQVGWWRFFSPFLLLPWSNPPCHLQLCRQPTSIFYDHN